MFNKALVPLDGSDVAEDILPYVNQLANSHGGDGCPQIDFLPVKGLMTAPDMSHIERGP